MLKIPFSILLIFIISSLSHFYSQNMDSLVTKLNAIPDDTNKVLLLNKISNYYISRGSPNKSLPYLDTQFELSTTLNYKKGKYFALINYGNVYTNTGNIDKGLEYFHEAITCLKSGINAKDQINMAVIYANIANTFGKKMDIANGLKYYIFAVHILEKLPNDNTTFITKIHQNMAILYEQNRDYKKALEYNKKSIAIFLKNKDTLNLAGVYPNLGSTYYKLKNYPKAIETYKKALYFAKRSKRISSVSSINVGLGLVYQDLKQYDLALKHHQEAYKIAKQNGLKEYMSSSLSNIGVDYHGLKQYELALKYLQESQEIAKELENLYLIKTNYQCISEVYESMNLDAKALEALKKSSEVNDSMFNDKNAKKINELSIKYETEKKEKKIAILHADNLKKQKDKIILKNHLEKKNSLIIGTLISAILLLITTILLYNRRRLILKNQHQKEINYQRENNTKAIVQAQEKEQTRIAKELHDSVGTYLSTLKINLQLYENEVTKNKQQEFFQSLKLIDKISNELRNIMRNLSNETLNTLGLESALIDIIQEINTLGITKVDYHNVGLNTRLEENIEHNLFRISQELLTNCIKHAKATQATLQLIENDNDITLIFEDNGIGLKELNTTESPTPEGMGLKNIRNRVEFLHGKIHIDTSPNNGTICIIEIPKNGAEVLTT